MLNKNQARLIYFVGSLITTSLFILNLFVGVVISSFMIEKERLKQSTLLTKLETEYIDACILCYKATPIISYKPSGWCIKDFCHRVVASKIFEYFTFACVVLSSFILILQWYGANTTQLFVLEIFNNVITVIFTLEIFLKVIGFGCSYWKNSWNILDFVCTVFSWIDLLVQLFSSLTMTAAFKIIRLFRVIRFIRLIGRLRD